MPHLSLLQNHPFTISNLPRECRLDAQEKGKDDPQEMVMYVRAHAGLSRDLLKSVRDKPRRSVRVHFDGPYDGLVDDLPRIFEEIIFVAGGSGIAGCLPWIEHCTRSIGRDSSMVRQVHVLWVVKDSSHLSWASRELEECARLAGDSVRFHLYVTDESLSKDTDALREPEPGQLPGENKEADGSGKPEQRDKGSTAFAGTGKLADVKIQRPYLPHLLPSLISRRRVAIFGE